MVEMIDLLRSRPGITVAELAEAFDRSERTIYRWLNELSDDLRMPLGCSGGGYYLAESPETRKVNLTPQELLALQLSLRSSPFTAGSPIKEHAELAWRKIRDAAPCERLEMVRKLAAAHAVTVNSPAAAVRSDVIEVLEEAVNSHCRLAIVYRSQKSDQVKEYTFDPYAIVFRRHSWYVVGFCHEHERVIQLKLARFRHATDTGVRFEPPVDFSIDEHFGLSWEVWAGGEPTTVRVRFSPRVARMIVESRRHPTQAVHSQKDGSVVFEVTVSGIEEIAAWIMGYGRDAQVLEPEHLRLYVAEHARAVADMYAGEQQ